MAVSHSKSSRPSKVVKPKQARKRTESHRQFRFKSFSERISTLKIDPIRKRRDYESKEELVDDKESYFSRSLARWRDSNLSQGFTQFAREVAPLCDNLPLVLHNQDQIMAMLVAHIGKNDVYALEPLLGLLADFARDLDVRFEAHFDLAVKTVASVASQHTDLQVVEWCFNCLAWLFKYLSRLLTPDLRPVYNLMSPFFGKQSQKPFIIRFAAESMSYLIRRTAAQREQSALSDIIEHILADVEQFEEDNDSTLYRQGVMNLISESAKGVKGELHSSGLPILRVLLGLSDRGKSMLRTAIATGILTTIIHFSNTELFEPVAELVWSHAESVDLKNSTAVFTSAELMFTISGVRKGNRIKDWSRMHTCLARFMLSDSSEQWTTATKQKVVTSFATMLAYSNVLSDGKLNLLFDALQSGAWQPQFLHLCDFLARLDASRFQRYVFKRMQSYLSSKELSDEQLDASLSILPPILPASNQSIKLSNASVADCNAIVQRHLTGGSSASEEDMSKVLIILNVLPFLNLPEIARNQMLASLKMAMQQANEDSSRASMFQRFVLGPCALAVQTLQPTNNDLLELCSEMLCSASEECGHMEVYWTNMRSLASSCEAPLANFENIQQSMIRALSSPSHCIRAAVLDTIQILLTRQKQEIPQALLTAILVESTPISMETSRAISMNIRRIGAEYADIKSDSLIAQAIPAHCFGLLHIRLSQAWTDVIATLGEIAKTSVGEDFIMKTAESWLQGGEDVEQAQIPILITASAPRIQVFSDFECPNLTRLNTMSKQIFQDENSGYPSAQNYFTDATRDVPLVNSESRGQCLKVLSSLAQLAEKRSRLLVPTLLQWAGSSTADEDYTNSIRWSRKDQKALLDIFAKFQNPRVLYKSTEVYAALQGLCKNGDVEIQKAALQAILAWKETAITRYREHLVNILDDTRFREELSVFLQGDDEDGLRREDQPQVMPVLLRLLYGKLVGASKDGQQSRRKAVFVAISKFGDEAMAMFIDVALSSTSSVDFVNDNGFVQQAMEQVKMPLRQQVGMLNMLGDLLATLGSGLQAVVTEILDPILGCTIIAQRRLDDADSGSFDVSLLRSVRQNGVQCLIRLFSTMESSELDKKAKIVTSELLLPRATKFVEENTEGVSSSLQLISSLTANARYLPSLYIDDGIVLLKVADLLGHDQSKNMVKLFILNEIVQSIFEDEALSHISHNITERFVTNMAKLLRAGTSKDLLTTCIKTLVRLASHIESPIQAQSILDICSFLLVQPAQLVPNWTKTDLLKTMTSLLNVSGVKAKQDLHSATSGLFSRFRDIESRAILSETYQLLSTVDDDLQEAAKICLELNSVSSARLDEPDHEKRDLAFAQIYQRASSFTSKSWTPIIHNCLYFIMDEDDTVNRASAAKTLQLLISTSSKSEDCQHLVKTQLFPAVQRGMTVRSEFVRAEFLQLLGMMVSTYQDWDEVSDMQSLTFDNDDEASFFTNVLHIQQHRRLRALRRLGEESKVHSKNIVRIFMPLLEQFVFDATPGDSGRALADQAVQTIGQLAKKLKWSDLRKTFQTYASYLRTKTDLQKTVLRLLGALVDGLDASVHDAATISSAVNEVDETGELASRPGEINGRSILPPNRAKIVINDFLPPLLGFLHHKDESDVDRRVGVAVSTTKLLRLLPEDEFVIRLAPMLTDVAHILRSRELEAREASRKTLSTILGLIGSSYLGFLLKELRGALSRGYQLHVLSYTVHHLLVSAESTFENGEVDDCVPDLVAVALDDIFGVTGQEKEAEEYKTSMKEIKSSKSYDTFDILARITSVTRLGQLILPIRALLQERLDGSTVKKIDNILTRVRRGIDLNPASETQGILVFCHELVRQVYRQQALSAEDAGLQDWKLKKYVSKPKSNAALKNATTSYIFKLTAFALGLVRKVVHRHEELRTATNMAGFLPMIGDGLVSGEQEVKIEAARLLSAILQLKLPELDANTKLYLKEAIEMVRSSQSTVTDTARAGLELATAILRERRDIGIKETDVAAMLRAIKADLDEPDRQGQIFKFLRAVLGRKIVITEVYDVMDEIAKIMVTNQDEAVRQNARAAYVTFVVDFPQSKERWSNTTGFLIKNLGYQHPGGRRSVLEAVHTLLGRLDRELVQSILLGFFVALVQRVVDETDNTCRQVATLLLSRVLESAADNELKQMKTLASKWLKDESKDGIRNAAVVSWISLVGVDKVSAKEISTLLVSIQNIVETESQSSSKLRIATLDLLLKLAEVYSEQTFGSKSTELIPSIQQLLVQSDSPVQPDSPVQLRCSKLIEAFYNDIASNMSKTKQGLAASNLRSAGGLVMSMEDLCHACTIHLRALRLVQADDVEVCAFLTKNVVFFGRVFAANQQSWKSSSNTIDGQADDHEETAADDADDEDQAEDTQNNAFGYLISRLAFLLRREDAPVLGRTSALRAAMALMHIPDIAMPNLHMITRALYVLTDTSIPQPPGEAYKNLSDHAREFMDAIQEKIGAEKYIKLLSAAKKQVGERRQERQRKRRIEAVSHPERSIKEKQRKHDVKKSKIKAKAQLNRERRRAY